jgi:adenylate kinase
MNLIIFGPPGAGKGTQSSFISKKYNLYQLSTGEILREQIRRKTELGIKISPTMNSGSFVSDEIVSELIEKFIKDEKYKNKIIFDGYPRSLDQVKILENLLMKYKQKIDVVLKLSVSMETIKKRIAERRSLEKRTDDYDEIAIKRFKTYEKTTEPVIEYYKKINLLKVIDGERSIEQINKEISDIIDLILS